MIGDFIKDFISGEAEFTINTSGDFVHHIEMTDNSNQGEDQSKSDKNPLFSLRPRNE